MPPKTESKGFRKGKAKAKGKQKQTVNVKVNIDLSKKSVQRQPSANIAKKGSQSQPRTLPAFSAVPQGLTGGVYNTPGIAVAPQTPMPKPEPVPDNTNQILTAYNNLLVQGAQAAQAQRFQEFRNTGGLNIQRPEDGFRSTTSQGNIYGTTPIPSGYIVSEPSIQEQAVDALTYDNPRINDVIEQELDYAPQLPDVSSSASISGMTLTEKQDNALSNLVYKEQLDSREKQVQKDLDNTGERDQDTTDWFEIEVKSKQTNKKKPPVSSSSSSSAEPITEYSLEPPIAVEQPLTPAEKRRQTMQKKKAAELKAKREQTQREWEAFLAAEEPVAINPFTNFPRVQLTREQASTPYTFV
jgi:hypothetical protein